MTAELNQQSLEECLERIREYQQETGERICAKPTRVFIPRYPDETDEHFRLRVEAMRHLARLGDLGIHTRGYK